MKYTNIKRNVKKEITERKTNQLKEITALKSIDEVLGNWYYKEMLTNKQIKDATHKNITLLEIKKILQEKTINKYNTELIKDIELLENIENAEEVNNIVINVEWVKNSTWGKNPHAKAEIFKGANGYEQHAGRASGCGYDKRTAAIAGALCESLAARKILCDAWEKVLKKDKNAIRRDALAYGCGYCAIPNFEGGIGISSYYNIFNACGYNMECVADTKNFDSYVITKKRGKSDKKITIYKHHINIITEG